MTQSDQIEYYVPGEIIFGFETSQSVSQWRRNSKWIKQSDFISDLGRLLDGTGLSPAEDFNTESFSQRVLPFTRDAGKSTALVKLRLNNPGNLSVYLQKVFDRVRSDLSNPSGEFRLTFVTPNWFGGHSQTRTATGGPSGKPEPAKTIDMSACTFSTDPKTIVPPDQQIQPSALDVYVLDTLPGVGAGGGVVQGPINPLGGNPLPNHIRDHAKFDNHPLGKMLGHLRKGADSAWSTQGGELKLTPAEALIPGVFDALYDPPGKHGNPKYYVQDCNDPGQTGPYKVSDHGLFIAGIIKEIAPDAHIHVIEVLNEFGVGTLESVVAAFEHIADLRNGQLKNPPYLVNCSFTFDTPVLDTDQYPPHDILDSDPLHQFVHDNPGYPVMLRQVMESLVPVQANCLVIGAAGNESTKNRRKAARYPANVDSVLGVGALTPDFAIEDYSNYSDTPVSNGIATVGKIQNIYTQEFPQGVGKNDSGFAVWSGTSFATPVVTGYIAQICTTTGWLPRQAANALAAVANKQILPSGEAEFKAQQSNVDLSFGPP